MSKQRDSASRLIAGAHALYAGDAESTRMYCGSYQLVRRQSDGRLFRSDVGLPAQHDLVPEATDADGYLLPQYWALTRLR